MSLLRDRMSRDMERAGLAQLTRKEYIAAIRHMTEFLGRPPEELGADDLRAWDDEMYRRGLGVSWVRVHVAALVFLYYSCCIFLLGAEITAAFYRNETTMNLRLPDAFREKS